MHAKHKKSAKKSRKKSLGQANQQKKYETRAENACTTGKSRIFNAKVNVTETAQVFAIRTTTSAYLYNAFHIQSSSLAAYKNEI